MKFEDRHAQVDDDPLIELERRLQPWATCPSSRGEALSPPAQIVPRSTVEGAIVLLKQWREVVDRMTRGKTRGSA